MTKEIIYKLLDELPEYWNKSENTTTYQFLYSIALELEVMETQIENMSSEIFVDTSTGNYLNELARLFRLSRKSNETDAQLRARVKSYWPGFSGGGTLDAFKATINRITDVPETDITLTEIDFMKVAIEIIFDSEEDYDLSEMLISAIEQIKAAGVYVSPNFVLTGSLFGEAVGITDAIDITTIPAGYWVAGVSLAGSEDVA